MLRARLLLLLGVLLQLSLGKRLSEGRFSFLETESRLGVGPSHGGLDRNSAMLGNRLHSLVLSRQYQPDQELLQLQEKQNTALSSAATVKAAAQTSDSAQTETQSSTKADGDPWWLKDLPWWMPPPPEWGPLPPTMYAAYWERPIGAPLSTPNYGPLYRRVEDMEPPLGHGAPLKTSPGSDPQANMEPPVEPKELKANFMETEARVRPANNAMNPFAAPPAAKKMPPASALELDPNKMYGFLPAPTSFLELDTQMSKSHGHGGADGGAGGSGGSSASISYSMTYDSLAGPRKNRITENLINFRVTRVPPNLRYDRFHVPAYQRFWKGVFKPKVEGPFGFKLAPMYPPDPRHLFENYYFSVSKGHWYRPPWYPSQYDEPTPAQQLRLQKIGEDQDRIPRNGFMKDPSPPPW